MIDDYIDNLNEAIQRVLEAVELVRSIEVDGDEDCTELEVYQLLEICRVLKDHAEALWLKRAKEKENGCID